MYDFGEQLIKWYRLKKRVLPWRQSKDPYKIWLSEVILQQTRIEQGLPYYQKFIESYPSIHHLAAAEKDEVYKIWQGLGYYNRADNLLNTAKRVVTDYNGKLPADFSELLKLKGIGPYTAAAIASIAFDIPVPAIDGNVYRVLSRVFGVEKPIDSASGKKEFEQLSSELMIKDEPGDFNQALMEFGALCCTPRAPDCVNCIFSTKCLAFNENRVFELPVKKSIKAVKIRYFYYGLIETKKEDKATIMLKKRTANDIWKNLYEFPLLETDTEIDPLAAAEHLIQLMDISDLKIEITQFSKFYNHQLTHQHIIAVFIHMHLDEFPIDRIEKSILLVSEDNIVNYPVSRLIERYLQDQKIIK